MYLPMYSVRTALSVSRRLFASATDFANWVRSSRTSRISAAFCVLRNSSSPMKAPHGWLRGRMCGKLLRPLDVIYNPRLVCALCDRVGDRREDLCFPVLTGPAAPLADHSHHSEA